MADKTRRASVGFQGGQVLSLRLSQEQLDALKATLTGAQNGWHEVEAQDGAVVLDSSQVVYLRVESEEQHVGF